MKQTCFVKVWVNSLHFANICWENLKFVKFPELRRSVGVSGTGLNSNHPILEFSSKYRTKIT